MIHLRYFRDSRIRHYVEIRTKSYRCVAPHALVHHIANLRLDVQTKLNFPEKTRVILKIQWISVALKFSVLEFREV